MVSLLDRATINKVADNSTVTVLDKLTVTYLII